MKTLLRYFLFCAGVVSIISESHSLAETVILGDNGLTNLTVNVPAGKMMVATASDLRYEHEVTISKGDIAIKPLESAGFDTRFHPRYLAGPCTFTVNLVFGFESRIFNYDVVPSNEIQTIVGTNSSILQVPAGKRLRILDASYPLWFDVALTNGVSAKSGVSPRTDPEGGGPTCNSEGFELSGPLTITFGKDQNDEATPFFVTYFFVTDVIQVSGAAIQSSAGSTIVVEKSDDFESWTPAFISTQQSEPKSFYRLRVAP